MLNISISVITVRPIKPLSTRHCGQRRHSFTPSVVRARPPESRVQTDQQRCYMSQQRCARSGRRGDVGGPYDVSGESTEAEKEGREGGTRRGAYPLRSHFNLKLLCNEQRARRASSWLSRLDLLQSHFNFHLSFP